MRALVVGGGSIGTRHLRNFRALGVETVAVVEPDARRRAELAAEGWPLFTRLDEGLRWQPHLVVLASPTDLHARHALQVAEAGCHLFVEKPLSHSCAGLDELERLVERHSLITLVGCNMRFHPGPQTVTRLLRENAIGRVLSARLQTGSYLPRWRPLQDYRQSYSASEVSGGATLDCIHEIDLALWYFGPARLLASAILPARSLGLVTDGLAEILLEHEGGSLSSVHLNFLQQDYRRGCQIIGSEGTVYWDFGERKVTRFDGAGERAQVVAEPEGWEVNQMYLDELAHFVQCVRQRRPTMNPISGGLAALRIALAVRDTRKGAA